jgi:hypothetical protein
MPTTAAWCSGRVPICFDWPEFINCHDKNEFCKYLAYCFKIVDCSLRLTSQHYDYNNNTKGTCRFHTMVERSPLPTRKRRCDSGRCSTIRLPTPMSVESSSISTTSSHRQPAPLLVHRSAIESTAAETTTTTIAMQQLIIQQPHR